MKTETARLLDQPEDYKRLGINPKKIEKWEDCRRNKNDGAGNWEWWYFDSILDDGSKVVIQFFTKAGMKKIKKAGDSPSVTIKITLPDGTEYNEEIDIKPQDCFYGEEQCDVRLGKHTFIGDFKEYHIHVDTYHGVGADLVLKSLAKPYRPGTAYFSFGDEGEYYTWLCGVPKGEVSGTIIINGETKTVHGKGYHGHQWGNQFYLPEWNHWVWARQSFEDYSVLVFDFVTSEKYGYQRFPIIFIQDKNGEIVFESKEGVDCTVSGDYLDDQFSGKHYPSNIHYRFENDGKKVEYTLNKKDILEAKGIKNLPLMARMLAKKLKMNVAYTRYAAYGELQFCTEDNRIERSGELIYEFMYPGESYEGHM